MWAGADAGHAPQQNAATHLRPFQVFSPFLNAHAAGHLAHRGEQRQLAAVVAQRFVGGGRNARRQHGFGQAAVGGEMKIGEDDLPGPQQRPLGWRAAL